MQNMGGATAPPPIPAAGTSLPQLPPVLRGALTQEICQRADRDAFLALGGYVFGALVFGLILFAVLHRKLVGGSNLQRIMMAASASSVVGALLVWVDPGRADVFLRCMNSTQFVMYLTLGAQPLARALAMGFAPAFAVTACCSFVYSKVK